jgi:hypothetical protein
VRIKILKQTPERIEDIRLERFRIGEIFEVGSRLAELLLAEGWAEPVDDDASARGVESAREPDRARRHDRSPTRR